MIPLTPKRPRRLVVHRFILGGIAVGLMAANLWSAHAQTAQGTQAGIARIISLQGKVEIRRAGTMPWIEAKTEMTLAEQDVVRTDLGAKVEIAFDAKKQNVTRLDENGEAVITSLAPPRLSLSKGKLVSSVKKLPRGSTFEVRTPTAVVGVRGTGWLVGTNGKITEAAAFDQTIFARGIDPHGNLMKEILIEEGFKTVFDQFGEASPLEELGTEEMDYWEHFEERLSELGGEWSGAEWGGQDWDGGGQFQGQERDQDQQRQQDDEIGGGDFGTTTTGTTSSTSSSSSSSSSSAS